MGPPTEAGRSPRGKRLRSDRARQVADVIRQGIVQGETDHILPDELTLQHEFEVSRNTVREALDILRREGLVERLPGIGTIVATAKYAHVLDSISGLGQSLSRHGTVTNEVRAAGYVHPPRAVTTRFELPDDSPMVYIERLRRLDGMPISLDLTYLPAPVGEPLLAADLESQDLFVLIEQTSGLRLGTAEISLEAVNADEHSASLLGVADRSALLVVQRLTRFVNGCPADLEFLRLRGDRMIIHLTPQIFEADRKA